MEEVVSGRITPTLPLALPAVVAAGAFAALVGGVVSLQAPCAWPDDAALLLEPPALGLPPLLAVIDRRVSARERLESKHAA